MQIGLHSAQHMIGYRQFGFLPIGDVQGGLNLNPKMTVVWELLTFLNFQRAIDVFCETVMYRLERVVWTAISVASLLPVFWS